MTADKLRVLFDPFNKRNFQIWHGKVACLVVFIVVLVVSSGAMMTYQTEVTTVEVDGDVIEGHECFSDYTKLTTSMSVVVILSEILPGAFLPFGTLVVLNSVTYWKFKQQNKKVQHMESIWAKRQEKEQRMIRMLRVLAIVFLLCYTPFMTGTLL